MILLTQFNKYIKRCFRRVRERLESESNETIDLEKGERRLYRMEPIPLFPTTTIRYIINFRLWFVVICCVLVTSILFSYPQWQMIMMWFALSTYGSISMFAYIRCYEVVGIFPKKNYYKIEKYQKLFTPYGDLLSPHPKTTVARYMLQGSSLVIWSMIGYEVRNDCLNDLVPSRLISYQCRPEVQNMIHQQFRSQPIISKIVSICFNTIIVLMMLDRSLLMIQNYLIRQNIEKREMIGVHQLRSEKMKRSKIIPKEPEGFCYRRRKALSGSTISKDTIKIAYLNYKRNNSM